MNRFPWLRLFQALVASVGVGLAAVVTVLAVMW